MPQPLRVLLLEDRVSDAKLVLNALKEADFEAIWERVETSEDFLARLSGNWDVILVDYSLPQFDALQALALVRLQNCNIPVIIVSGTIGEETAVAAMKEGASDYLLKDRLGRLGQAVRQAIAQRQLHDAQRQSERVLLERTRLTMLAAEVSLALSSDGGLKDVLGRCAQSIATQGEFSRVRIWALNGGQKLSLQANVGVADSAELDSTTNSPPALEFKAVTHQSDDQSAIEIVGNAPRSGRGTLTVDSVRGVITLPLMIEDRIVGAVELFTSQELTSAKFDILSSIANQLASGIERKRTEERLRLTQFTLDHIATPVLWADAEGRFFNVNNAACQLSGYPRDELLLLDNFALHLTLSRESWLRIWNEIRQRGSLNFESTLQTKVGAQIPINVVSNLLNLDGRECCCTFLQDISERKHLEAQVRQAQKMEAVGRLAGGIAHDFNNLLTIILGYCEVLQEGLRAGDPIRDSVEQIFLAGKRAAQLTRQLLAFSRKQMLTPVVLDVNLLFQDMEKMLGRLIGEDIDLRFSLGPNLWKTRCDPGQAEQIIMNLVVNARDAMPQGGKLEISTANVELSELDAAVDPDALPGNYVVIRVSDNGCGMNEPTLARIFEPFFSTKGEQGTGLGLATVYGIVRQSGGHIAVRSSPGAGSTFEVFLPRSGDHAQHDLQAAPAIANSPSKQTVLLVEDEDGVRMLAKLTLERNGYHVLAARNGADALLLCESHSSTIDLLLTDVVMPNMSGRELYERIGRLQPTLQVIYMSGYMDDSVVRHGVLHANVPFLQKPFTAEMLVRKIREVIAGAGQSRGGEHSK